jgi:hypothetical protein
MDENIRLKTKVGDHEFEAEGSPEYVREQFQAWQELVKLAASAAPANSQQRPSAPGDSQAEVLRKDDSKIENPNIDAELTKIMKVDGRYVSLTARTSGIHDAVLVMLYGQKALRNNDSVTGAELLSGLAATGGFGDPRLDRILDKLAADGDVMSFGERRGKKYRLTNTGIAKSRTIAKELIATVA